MGRFAWWMVAGLLALGPMPGAAFAESEVDALIDKLTEKGILTPVEAGQIRREMAEGKEARNKQLAKDVVPDSARNWKWKGDIRLRNEFRNQEGTGNDRNRQRIRFRYGFEGKVADDLKVAARIATGQSSTGGTGGDPVSTNQSFDTNFSKKNIALDLAYIEYTPEVPGITKTALVGGIMENPLWTVGPLVWDSDLSMDGAAVKLSKKVGSATELFANSGAFSLDTDETESASLWVTQGGASFTPFTESEHDTLKNLKLTGGVAYHDYRNVANAAKAGTDIIARETQNSPPADFNQLNPSLELASVIGGYPLSLYGDWVRNTSASSRVNDGFQVGTKFGKAKSQVFSFANGLNLRDSWETGYYFQELQRDAAFDEFTDSDFNDGGTNNRGHVFWLTLATLKNSTLGAKYIMGENLEGAKDVEERFQLDWVTKF